IMKIWVAWGLITVLAVALLGSVGLLCVRLKPYWVARYHGEMADLHGAFLPYAPLAGANLCGADLTHACLRGANLDHASLEESVVAEAKLHGARLTGADLG